MSRCLAVNTKWRHAYKYWNADLNCGHLLGSLLAHFRRWQSAHTCSTGTNRRYFILATEPTAERWQEMPERRCSGFHGCLDPWSAALSTGFEILSQGLKVLFYTPQLTWLCARATVTPWMLFKERLSRSSSFSRYKVACVVFMCRDPGDTTSKVSCCVETSCWFWCYRNSARSTPINQVLGGLSGRRLSDRAGPSDNKDPPPASVPSCSDCRLKSGCCWHKQIVSGKADIWTQKPKS